MARPGAADESSSGHAARRHEGAHPAGCELRRVQGASPDAARPPDRGRDDADLGHAGSGPPCPMALSSATIRARAPSASTTASSWPTSTCCAAGVCATPRSHIRATYRNFFLSEHAGSSAACGWPATTHDKDKRMTTTRRRTLGLGAQASAPPVASTLGACASAPGAASGDATRSPPGPPGALRRWTARTPSCSKATTRWPTSPRTRRCVAAPSSRCSIIGRPGALRAPRTVPPSSANPIATRRSSAASAATASTMRSLGGGGRPKQPAYLPWEALCLRRPEGGCHHFEMDTELNLQRADAYWQRDAAGRNAFLTRSWFLVFRAALPERRGAAGAVGIEVCGRKPAAMSGRHRWCLATETRRPARAAGAWITPRGAGRAASGLRHPRHGTRPRSHVHGTRH